ncbi:MAG: hypothetical protein ACWGO1_02225, partial [Anaerolineales bacterium]
MANITSMDFELVMPAIVPPLDNGFRPASLANRAFLESLAGEGVPLVIGLERDNRQFTRFETQVFPEG